jgi:NAD(P)H dehydrogenase (quinone)
LNFVWKGHRVVELEGPERVTPNEIAATFARLLGRPVRMEAVPRGSWEALFKSQGMKNPIPRIRMLDGFNEGWIDFEHGEPSYGFDPFSRARITKTLGARWFLVR